MFSLKILSKPCNVLKLVSYLRLKNYYFRFLDYFYDGIVELCLTIALQRDPTGIALHYFKHGEPREDQEGHDMFNYR